LRRSSAPQSAASLQAMRPVAASVGVELLLFDAGGPGDYVSAFAAMRASGVQALAITSHPELFRDSSTLSALAIEARLPTVCQWAEMARSGCLIAYGPSLTELYRLAADYVSRIFQGIPPSDLPIEQPTRYEMTVNLKTAKALGLEIPPTFLARADEVIE
jgi:putative ABC transport system substrate-binding protein